MASLFPFRIDDPGCHPYKSEAGFNAGGNNLFTQNQFFNPFALLIIHHYKVYACRLA
jgi:hypothetical protein